MHKILLKVQIDMWILRRDYAISIIIYRIRGGTKSWMLANYLDFGNVREVRSSVFGQNHMFRHVRSSVLMILKKIGPIFY